MDRTKPVTDWKSGLPETPCGKGSRIKNTEEIRGYLPEVIERYGINTVADVGCGDQNWIHRCLPERVEYTGFDIRPRFPDVKPLNAASQVLPEPFDLVLCIYVLNHMNPDMAERALRLFKMSGSQYLLMSYSSADEYALLDCELVESIHHKERRRDGHKTVEWRYGLWRLNRAFT
jgi:hypothetical protein